MPSIFITQDGSHSLMSDEFDVPYHSKYGAIQETQHVFIDAALRPRAEEISALNILEIGFGTGLNALMTLQFCLANHLHINYVAYEKFPVSVEQAATFNYTSELKIQSEDAFMKMHNAPWEELTNIAPGFDLTKKKQDFDSIEDKNTYDIIYFDAFAPNAQPELWQPALLQKMYDALNVGGVMTTYCAKGQVKRDLKSVGFDLKALPGPPGKREMTQVWKR